MWYLCEKREYNIIILPNYRVIIPPIVALKHFFFYKLKKKKKPKFKREKKKNQTISQLWFVKYKMENQYKFISSIPWVLIFLNKHVDNWKHN